MKILGVSFDYHDSSATLVIDGKVVAAAQEERFTRVKHDASLPKKSIDFCLEQAGIDAHELDAIVHFENPFLKFDRILDTGVTIYKKSSKDAVDYLDRVTTSWLKAGKFEVAKRISDYLEVSDDIIHYVTHHESHTGAAFFPSPFDESTIITLDGAGEYETYTVSVGKNNQIKKCFSQCLPHSLGLFYSAFTAYLGFEVNEGEYKVMGMAGFGKPIFLEKIAPMIELHDDGGFTIDQTFFEFINPKKYPFNKKLEKLLGPAREPESTFNVGDPALKFSPNSEEGISRHYANIAASVQVVTENVIQHVVSCAIKRTGIKNVCVSGGVSLNSLANGKLQRALPINLYVHPCAGDAGSSLGAALFYYHSVCKKPRAIKNNLDPYLGKEFDAEDCVDAIRNTGAHVVGSFNNDSELTASVAKLLADGAVIGWGQGQFEWGPRALGNRSILANPTLPEIQRIVNKKIKFREPFRPFAPAVIAEHAHEYFELAENNMPGCLEQYMLSVAFVRPEKRHLLPAITHIDGTARVQLVTRESNLLFYKLLRAFQSITGVPVLLNTSFNLRGEPMVSAPRDMVKTFSWSNMDYLVMDKFIIDREICVI